MIAGLFFWVIERNVNSAALYCVDIKAYGIDILSWCLCSSPSFPHCSYSSTIKAANSCQSQMSCLHHITSTRQCVAQMFGNNYLTTVIYWQFQSNQYAKLSAEWKWTVKEDNDAVAKRYEHIFNMNQNPLLFEISRSSAHLAASPSGDWSNNYLDSNFNYDETKRGKS